MNSMHSVVPANATAARNNRPMSVAAPRTRGLALLVAWGILGLAVPAFAQTPYRDEVLLDSPLIYWRLNDPASADEAANLGTLGNDPEAKFKDSLNHTQPGLLASETDTAIVFNDGRIELDDTDELNDDGPYETKTVELWFSTTQTLGRQVLYAQGDKDQGLVIYLDGDQLYMAAYQQKDEDDGDSSPWGDPPKFVKATQTIQAGTAYHVAFVMQGAATGFSGELIGYLNGVEFARTGGIGRLFEHDKPVLGDTKKEMRFHDNTKEKKDLEFVGTLDEVALYDTVLPANRVLAHYLAGLGTPTGGIRIQSWQETK